jgi:hypothetical protein
VQTGQQATIPCCLLCLAVIAVSWSYSIDIALLGGLHERPWHADLVAQRCADVGSQEQLAPATRPDIHMSKGRSSRRKRSRAMTRLDRRGVKFLTILGFAIPAVAYLVFLQHYQVNAVFGDQWDDVVVIHRSFVHFPD